MDLPPTPRALHVSLTFTNCGDQAAGAVGVGAVEPGIVGLTVGTSGVVFATTPSALIEPEGRLHAFCHAVPGMWHFMGVMLSAAGSLQWYRNMLAPDMSFDDLLKEAEAIPAGSEGLQFLPYLSGERTPHPDPLARGAFIGLTLRHSRAHMTRAVLEGVAFGLKDNFTLIQNAGLGSITQVCASGGGTKGALWRQILASVLNAELVTVNTTEGAAYGAALLAGIGAGKWGSVMEERNLITTTEARQYIPKLAFCQRIIFTPNRGPDKKQTFIELTERNCLVGGFRCTEGHIPTEACLRLVFAYRQKQRFMEFDPFRRQSRLKSQEIDNTVSRDTGTTIRR